MFLQNADIDHAVRYNSEDHNTILYRREIII
jgi:hypothetical protein